MFALIMAAELFPSPLETSYPLLEMASEPPSLLLSVYVLLMESTCPRTPEVGLWLEANPGGHISPATVGVSRIGLRSSQSQ